MELKGFLLTIIIFLSLSASAQLKKGAHFIGATIGSSVFSAGTTEYSQGYASDNVNFNISLSPSYGKFLKDNLVAGVSFLVNSSYQKINYKTLSDTIYNSSKWTSTDIGLGLFSRYYFSTEKKLIPFLHGFVNGGIGFGNNSGFNFGNDGVGAYMETYKGKTSNRSFVNAGLNFGVTRLLNPTVGIDAYAGYVFSYSRLTSETTSVREYTSGGSVEQEFSSTQKFTGNGLNVGIGVQVFLN